MGGSVNGDRWWVIAVLLLVAVSGRVAAQGSDRPVRYFQVAALPLEVANEQALLIDTGATGAGKDTLFQLRSATDNPLAYYRKVTTEVCFEGNCRLLQVHLYWNVTGRYLGFELPPGEFLSKAEHEPFRPDEYHALNDILADSLSPLGNFSYDDLVPKAAMGGLLDGVTGPTSKDVLRHVVKGAVYTTYTMWHLVYGRTRDEVMRITEEALTPGLVCQLLASPDVSDRHWALSRIRDRVPVTPQLRQALLAVINGTSYSLAERALAAIPSDALGDDSLQQGLLAAFVEGDYSLKKLVIDKLMEAPVLNSQLIGGFRTRLDELNGEPLAGVFRLFGKFNVTDPDTLAKIRSLERSPNRYIANLAARYLREVASSAP